MELPNFVELCFLSPNAPQTSPFKPPRLLVAVASDTLCHVGWLGHPSSLTCRQKGGWQPLAHECLVCLFCFVAARLGHWKSIRSRFAKRFLLLLLFRYLNIAMLFRPYVSCCLPFGVCVCWVIVMCVCPTICRSLLAFLSLSRRSAATELLLYAKPLRKPGPPGETIGNKFFNAVWRWSFLFRS